MNILAVNINQVAMHAQFELTIMVLMMGQKQTVTSNCVGGHFNAFGATASGSSLFYRKREDSKLTFLIVGDWLTLIYLDHLRSLCLD